MTTAEWLAIEDTLYSLEDTVTKDSTLLMTESKDLRYALRSACDEARKFAAEAALREYEETHA